MKPEKSTPVNIPATTVRRQFGDVVRRVYSGQEHFIVEKDGLPVAAIISIEEYQHFVQEQNQREKRLQEFETAARAMGEIAEKQGLNEQDVDSIVEAMREKLKQ